MESSARKSVYPTAVKVWLVTGLFMILMQVVIGGITRLTGSGLSITKWEIITGTLPPMNGQQWEEAFDLYKSTPQYQKINEGMSLSEFKFIYFWEYFHRLWARLMGFVFIIPFMIFLFKGWLDRPLLRRLGVVILLAAVVASFGWIMVASGLIERPWVNAYKLTMHLSLALILFSYLLWTTFKVIHPDPEVINTKVLKSGALVILIVLSLQIILGGIVSGMKAALFYPTWPDMHGEIIPSVLFDPAQWTTDNFIHYDSTPFMAALVQSFHRFTAYLLVIIGLWYFFRGINASIPRLFKRSLFVFMGLLIIQVLLGIFTLINSIGVVPVGLGVLHQGVALLLLAIVLFLNYQAIGKARSENVGNYVEKTAMAH